MKKESHRELKRKYKKLKCEVAQLRATIAWLLWSVSEPAPTEGEPWKDGDGVTVRFP